MPLLPGRRSTRKRPSVADVNSPRGLSPEQEAACALATSGAYSFLFVTGGAGTGKSVTLRELAKETHALVAAPTGAAALNVDGSTIHRLFGLGVGIQELGRPHGSANGKGPSRDKLAVLQYARLLIIDEISMVRADLLDAMDHRLRTIRGVDRPFGGLGVVAFGDMHQLPPVIGGRRVSEGLTEKQVWLKDARKNGWGANGYFFDSQVVRELTDAGRFGAIRLTKVHRQADPQFVAALDALRGHDIDADVLDYLNGRVVGRSASGLLTLTDKNAQVDAINRGHLKELAGKARIFERTVSSEEYDEPWWSDPLPEAKLALKVGAHVLFTKNGYHYDEETHESQTLWANGDTGVVEALGSGWASVRLNRTGETHEVQSDSWDRVSYRQIGGRRVRVVEATAHQLPLRVAAAITIHKSQGMSIDRALVAPGDKDMDWATGLGYVALSRLRSYEGLHLRRELRASDFSTDPRVVEFTSTAVPALAAWQAHQGSVAA